VLCIDEAIPAIAYARRFAQRDDGDVKALLDRPFFVQILNFRRVEFLNEFAKQ